MILNRTGSSPTHGFSFLELMITLAIVAILAALAMPTYTSTIAKRRVIGAAEAVLSDLRWARSEAFKRNVNVRVTFTTGSSWSYAINADPEGSHTLIKSFSGSSFPDTALSSASFRPSVSYTTFDPVRGVNPNNGTVILTSGSYSASVTVSTLGRMRICNAPGGYESC